MKFSRGRRLAALLMLACAAVQAATTSVALAGVLSIVRPMGNHLHTVLVVPEDGHLHVVFSHDSVVDPVRERSLRLGRVGHAEVSSDGDHVFHLGDPAQVTARRAAVDPAPPLALAMVLPRDPSPRVVCRPPPERRARDFDLLRTVVLRL